MQFVTYSDLFAFAMMISTILGLVFTILTYSEKKEITAHVVKLCG